MATLYVGNDMRLALEGNGKLLDDRREPVSGATIEATIYKYGSSTGVDGVSWPIVLSEGSKEGEYSGVIPGDADIKAGEDYLAELDITTPGGAKGFWHLAVQAQYRRF